MRRRSAEASLALARGEALHGGAAPTTSIDGCLNRCALKTGKLRAACALAGEYGLLLRDHIPRSANKTYSTALVG